MSDNSQIEGAAAKKLKLSNEEPEENMDNNDEETEENQECPNYNLFFNTLEDVPIDNCITFKDLLTVGRLKESLHMTYEIEKDWFLEQYSNCNVENSKIDVWCQKWDQNVQDYTIRDEKTCFKNTINNNEVVISKVLSAPYKTHHSKISLFYYEDNDASAEFLKVVVMTANLTSNDWNTHNQGIWISPKCKLQCATDAEIDPAKGESKTMFKATLLSYLYSYRDENEHLTESLIKWVKLVMRADFKNISVVLIASAPGKYDIGDLEMPENCYPSDSEPEKIRTCRDYFCNHHNLIKKTLKDDAFSTSEWYIIVQPTVIGTMPKTKRILDLLPSLATTKTPQQDPPVYIKYLSQREKSTTAGAENSATEDTNPGGLFYSEELHKKQTWIEKHLIHLRTLEGTGRAKYLPHIKSYCRVSPDSKRLSWFLLSSASITQPAWGSVYNNKLEIGNYEVGVLFFPKFFNEDYFAIEGVKENKRTFPLIYDVKPAHYDLADKPYFRN